LLTAIILASVAVSYGEVDTVELGISAHGTPMAILVSTSAYTNVTPASVRTLVDMTAVLIDNPSTNTGTMHGHIGGCTSTSVSVTDVKGPIEIAPSSNGGSIGIADDQCIWMVSRHTSAEYLTIQAVEQGR